MKFRIWSPQNRYPNGLVLRRHSHQMDFSQKEQDIFDKFKKKCGHLVSQQYDYDFHLAKWLIARKFNIEKAEAMLLKHVAWRKEIDVENIVSWQPPEVLLKYYPVGICGNDNQGCPMWIIPFGHADMKGIIQSCSKKEYMRFTIRALEKCLQEMSGRLSTEGDPIRQMSCIFDLEGFMLSQVAYKPVMDLLIELVKTYEQNMPEMLKNCFVINAPRVFTIAYAAVKPFIDEATIDKIQIYGTSGWRDPILKVISPAVLPKHWGGTVVDSDGDTKCQSKIVMGGPIPKSYYKKKRLKEDSKKTEKYKKLIVGKGGKETLKYEVTNSGTMLSWDFQTEDFDIGFGIHRETATGTETLLPLSRVNCHLVPEEGTILCIEVGQYVLTFDNEFSYLRSKEILHNVSLKMPSETTRM